MRSPSSVAEPTAWRRAAFLVYGPSAAAALGWLAWRGGPDLIWARLVGTDVVAGLVLGGLAGLGLLGVSIWLAQFWRPARRFEQAFTELIGPLRPATCWLLAATSSVVEEIVFRATIQPELGLWITSLVFGGLHFPFSRRLLLWPLFVSVVGLLLGYIYERTGTLAAPIATHFVVNLVNLYRLRERPAETAAGEVAPLHVSNSEPPTS
ncbi:MAG: lysostaphin resistance A-like protein [Planctomycetota bacterium]